MCVPLHVRLCSLLQGMGEFVYATMNPVNLVDIYAGPCSIVVFTVFCV